MLGLDEASTLRHRAGGGAIKYISKFNLCGFVGRDTTSHYYATRNVP